MTGDAPDPMELLEVMASGVVVLSTFRDDAAVGVALPSLASYSIDPPSVVASVPLSIGRLLSPRFGVSLLASSQQETGGAFWHNPGRLEQFVVSSGVPYLPETLADLACRPTLIDEQGEALIVVAEVTAVSIRHGIPLLWLDGTFVAA